MKKLGLRAVAGGLALLLTASVFAPATPANAADVLLIAQAPKTLVITADMVDDDGEIVISNEKWDRIIIEKEAAAKDIYFDGVEVGELIVESGNSAKVQLWDVDAEQVTVKEAELDNLTLKDLATLLADKETRAETIEMYLAIRAKNESAKKTAPTIVTMEDAKVDKMVARANAALDLAAGEVGVVALEASSEVATARVTLRNYEGDVAFTGTEGKSNMILNNVNSTIESLKVEESAADNRLTVNSKGSVIEKAEIGGNAKVSLNIPMKSLEVTEEASAANVRVLNKVDEMEVAADSAKVEVTASGVVKEAEVTGDKVNIGGKGCLTNVEITGSDAYVSTEGTKVEGENNYVRPVYVEMPYDSWSEDFSDATLEAGVATDDASLNYAKYRYDAENGYGVVSTTAGWQGFAISLDNLDNGSPAYFVASVRVKKLGGISNGVRVTENGAWPDLGDRVDIGEEWVTVTTDRISVPAGSSRTIMIAPLDGSAGVTLEMAVDNVVVKRYTDWTEPPARPKPTENVTYTFDDLTLGTNYGVTTSIVNGSLNISYVEQYQEAQYNLPVGMFTDDYDKILVDFEECTGTICFKVFAGGKTLNAFYGNSGDCVLDLSPYGGYEVTHIGIMQDNAGQGTCEAVINSFTFVVAAEDEGGEEGGETEAPEVDLTGATKCETDPYQVHHFKDVNLKDYAGTKVSFSVDMVRVGGDGSVAIVAQDSAYNAMYEAAEIGETWKTYTYTLTVPKDYGDAYLGFRWKTNPVNNYADYAFYFKNFKFEGTKVEGGDDNQGSTGDKLDLTGATKCETDPYQVHHFKGYNLADYAGTEVKFSVDMVRVGGDGSEAIVAQDSAYDAMYVAAEIGETWKTYTYTIKVPENYGDAYVGFRWKNGPVEDFADYAFYFKNFKFEGTKVEKDSVTITAPADTVMAGETLQLTANASGAVTWASSDKAIATVDETGLVTAVTGGAVKITATVGKASDSVDLTVKTPEAKFVTITAATKELYLDGTLQLSAATNDGEGTITWKSSDETIAKVDATGKVTAQGIGETTVTITASCEGYDSATVTLKVKDYEVSVDVEKEVLYVGETTKVVVTHDAGNDAVITFESDDEDVVTVDEDGNIIAVAAGTAMITVDCEGKFTVTVDVEVKANYVTLTGEKTITMKVGDTAEFTYEASQNVIVTSSKPEVATAEVVDGKIVVVAKAEGEATITVKSGDASVEIKATVEKPETPKFVTTADSVKATANDDGSITVVTTENYNGIRFSIPSTDAKVGQVIVNVTTNEQIGIQVYGKNGTMLAGDYPGYDYTEAVTKDYVLYVDPFVDVPSSIQIQANGDGDQTFTVNSVKIVTEDLVKYTDLIVYPDQDETATIVSNADGSATITSAQAWSNAFYQFGANNITLDGRTTVKIEVETAAAVQVCLLNNDWSAQEAAQAGWGLSNTTTLVLGIEIPKDVAFTQINFQASEANQTFIVKSITFSTVLDEIQLN
ncbi:MAG: hypothetical protein E7268_05535 [Lachnospiraceae bacterium]|nr:hypothetical protein [Lachnospiraceae bacterium]